jgi:UDP-N-acetylmuramoylalanine--D-glutamate ligase
MVFAVRHDESGVDAQEVAIVTDAPKRTLVVGLGATGLAVARYLAARQEPLVLADSRSAPPALAALRDTLPETAVTLGALPTTLLDGIDRVVLSPGLAVDIPLIAEAGARGIPVVSEIELFAEAARAPVLAVTGSNGKSTVVTLAAEMLSMQGFSAPRGGNLGPPALELLSEPGADAYVLEISSFQLETTRSLRPLAAALLNVSADHLDRHGSLERYAELKRSLLRSAENAIVNWDDPLVRPAADEHAHAVVFSVHNPLERGYSVVELAGTRWLARDLEPLIPSAELGLHGTLGEANSLAALALASTLGGAIEPALEALRSFAGLPHRCRKIAERAGVGYVDDSKGTNVGATVAAVRGLAGPAILIAGGLGKGASFAPLAELPPGRLRAAVLIGEAAPDIERALAGVCPTVRAAGMRDAVAHAAQLAVPGDTVLLSPACASQDMFVDYRDRGAAFAQAVMELDR